MGIIGEVVVLPGHGVRKLHRPPPKCVFFADPFVAFEHDHAPSARRRRSGAHQPRRPRPEDDEVGLRRAQNQPFFLKK